jgi:hypothetical protein
LPHHPEVKGLSPGKAGREKCKKIHIGIMEALEARVKNYSDFKNFKSYFKSFQSYKTFYGLNLWIFAIS